MERVHRDAEVPTHMSWSICNLLCCCLPLGILALVSSIKADNANKAGDATAAMSASRQAKNLNIAGLVCGIILLPIVIYYQVTRMQKEQ